MLVAQIAFAQNNPNIKTASKLVPIIGLLLDGESFCRGELEELTSMLPNSTLRVYARPNILEAWKIRYGESVSGSRGCQLCHQRAEGHDGWNSYGFAIRFSFIEIFGSLDIDATFSDVEELNSDGNPEGLTNFYEIQQGLDPGWKVGAVNPISFKEDPTLENQLLHFQVLMARTPIFCFPVLINTGVIVAICL